MRGQIKAVSEVGKGSKFTLEIPARARYSKEQIEDYLK
jgi:hypothetical protein